MRTDRETVEEGRYNYYYEHGQLFGKLPYSSKYDEFSTIEEYFDMVNEMLEDYDEDMGE